MPEIGSSPEKDADIPAHSGRIIREPFPNVEVQRMEKVSNLCRQRGESNWKQPQAPKPCIRLQGRGRRWPSSSVSRAVPSPWQKVAQMLYKLPLSLYNSPARLLPPLHARGWKIKSRDAAKLGLVCKLNWTTVTAWTGLLSSASSLEHCRAAKMQCLAIKRILLLRVSTKTLSRKDN